MPDGSLTHLPILPVAVIGGGPVGLAAAAHLRARGLIPLVLEAGPDAGSVVRAWGHVHMFSPWRFNVDTAACCGAPARLRALHRLSRGQPCRH